MSSHWTSLISWIFSFIYLNIKFNYFFDLSFSLDIFFLNFLFFFLQYSFKREDNQIFRDFKNSSSSVLFYKSFIGMIPDGVTILTNKKKIKFTNEKSCKMLSLDNFNEIKSIFLKKKNILSTKNNMEESVSLRSRIFSEKLTNIEKRCLKINEYQNNLKDLQKTIYEEEEDDYEEEEEYNNEGLGSKIFNKINSKFDKMKSSIFKRIREGPRHKQFNFNLQKSFSEIKEELKGERKTDKKKAYKKLFLDINDQHKRESIKKIFYEKLLKNDEIGDEIVNNFYISNHQNLNELLDFIYDLIEETYKEAQVKSKLSIIFDIGFVMAFESSVDEKKIVEIRLVPAIFKGVSNILLVSRDKTYVDTIYELKKKDEDKDIVMASVTHELRTPLNGMIAMLEILKNRINKNLIESYLNPSITSAKILMNLINDILDGTQIKEGKFKLICVDFNIKNLLKNSLDLISIQAKNKGVMIDLKIDNKIPKNWNSDPNRLRQVILNLLGFIFYFFFKFLCLKLINKLLGNALKFTMKGKIIIKVDYLNEFLLKISVEDSGIGISKENQKKLFNAFGKIENKEQITMNPQGVGLGLMISNNIAKKLGPELNNSGLSVFSTVGEGSTFSFLIEQKKSLFEEEKVTEREEDLNLSEESPDLMTKMQELQGENYSEEEEEEENNVNGKKKRDFFIQNDKLKKTLHNNIIDIYCLNIQFKKNLEQISDYFNKKKCNCPPFLIVDDNDFNIMCLEKLFEECGFLTHKAYNGQEALEKILERSKKICCKNYEIIFMDCEMPVMNGFTASSKIINLEKEGIISNNVIIATTAYGEESEIIKCLKFGMQDYLSKPISIDSLRDIIIKWISKKDYFAEINS